LPIRLSESCSKRASSCHVELIEGDAAIPLIELVHRRYVTPAGERLPAAGVFLASDDIAVSLLPGFAVTWDERASRAARELGLGGAALPLESTAPRDAAAF
jgi:hypothetical protein